MGFGGTGPQGGSSSSYIGFSCEKFRLEVIRVYLGMVTCLLEHVCAGGGGNVTFLGIRLSRGIPLSLMLACTSGPQRSGMFRWSWCHMLYNWRERRTRPLGLPTRVSNRPVYAVISVMPDV